MRVIGFEPSCLLLECADFLVLQRSRKLNNLANFVSRVPSEWTREAANKQSCLRKHGGAPASILQIDLIMAFSVIAWLLQIGLLLLHPRISCKHQFHVVTARVFWLARRASPSCRHHHFARTAVVQCVIRERSSSNHQVR